MDLHLSCLSPSCAPRTPAPLAGLSRTELGDLRCVFTFGSDSFWHSRLLWSHSGWEPQLCPPVLVNLLLSAAQWGVPKVPTALYLGAHVCRAGPQPWEQPVVGPGPAQGQLCIPRALRSLLLCRALSVSPSLQILNKCQCWESVLAWDHLCWVRCPGVLGPHIAHPGLCPLR